MDGTDVKHVGGLVLEDTERPIEGLGSAGHLQNGPDVSWLPYCRPGDDQGADGACAIFAFASWSEIVHRRDISDAECLDVYRRALRHAGRPSGGLSFGEAFRAAVEAGWLPGAPGISRARDLGALREQPLVAGYALTPAWRRATQASGLLDHSEPASKPFLGNHAVVIVARRRFSTLPAPGPLIYVENSWGSRWGWQGVGVMSEALHRTMIREIWRIA